jgi:hypothetical protein
MKKITEDVDDRLLDYLDGKLSGQENIRIENLMESDREVRKRFSELKEIESGLKHLGLERPAKNFTTSVMNRLDDDPIRAAFSLKNNILLLIGVVLGIGAGAWLLAAGVFDQTQTTFQLPQLPLAQKYMETLPSLKINSKLLINTILLVNLALALLLFDRAILKPLFKRRMEMKEGSLEGI